VRPLSRWFAEPGGGADRLVAFGREGERTRADLRRDVAALAAQLAPAGGSRIALHCHDAYAFAVGLLAAAQAGAVAVLPPSRQAGALARLAGQVAGFVLDGAHEPRVAGRTVWAPLGDAQTDPAALGAPGPAASLGALARDALLVEHFTSGTTGDEKPVPKAVRHLEDEVAVLGARFDAALGPGARMLSTASPQHLYGLLFRVLWPLAAGRPFLRTPILHPEELAPYMDVDFALASTPAALRRLAERSELAAHAVRCRAVFSSGGPLELDVARGIAVATGAPPYEIYGSTETGGVAVRRQRSGDEPWQLLPGVAVDFAPEDGRLVVTSPFVSSGEPVGGGRTRLHTGDRGEPAGAGGFRLRGRVDRVVKIAEKRLSLPDMESRLREHPAVADVALVLMEDGPGEPRVAAVVVPTAEGRARYEAGGRRALGRNLAEHLASDFDRVLLPRAWRVADALPRDAQGKTSVRALRALVNEAPTRPELLEARREPGLAEVDWRVPADLAQLEGHFPGHPVVAGVVQLSWVMGELEELLGEAPQLESLEALKFHDVLGPGERVRLRLELEEGRARFRFLLADAERPERTFASGRGRLKG
jgi:acyl-coenzyme A synthetase/AMP-(fatty) acid ligase